ILVAVVELILLVVAGGALLTRRDGSHSPAATASPPASQGETTPPPAAQIRPPPAAAPKLARAQGRVGLLTGTATPRAAAAAAARVRGHGYKIGKVGNAARMSYSRSIVMYRPGFEGEGRRLARDLGILLVGPLDGMRPSELQGAQTVLILGA